MTWRGSGHTLQVPSSTGLCCAHSRSRHWACTRLRMTMAHGDSAQLHTDRSTHMHHSRTDVERACCLRLRCLNDHECLRSSDPCVPLAAGLAYTLSDIIQLVFKLSVFSQVQHCQNSEVVMGQYPSFPHRHTRDWRCRSSTFVLRACAKCTIQGANTCDCRALQVKLWPLHRPSLQETRRHRPSHQVGAEAGPFTPASSPPRDLEAGFTTTTASCEALKLQLLGQCAGVPPLSLQTESSTLRAPMSTPLALVGRCAI